MKTTLRDYARTLAARIAPVVPKGYSWTEYSTLDAQDGLTHDTVCSYCSYYAPDAPVPQEGYNPTDEHLQSHPITGERIPA